MPRKDFLVIVKVETRGFKTHRYKLTVIFTIFDQVVDIQFLLLLGYYRVEWSSNLPVRVVVIDIEQLNGFFIIAFPPLQSN